MGITREILNEYAESDKLIDAVVKSGLEPVLDKVLQKIKQAEVRKDFAAIASSSGFILSEVNQVMSRIKDQNEKLFLEVIVSSVFKDKLNDIFLKAKNDGVYQQVREQLQSACEFHEYDFERLCSLIGIPINTIKRNTSAQFGSGAMKPFYQWTKHPAKLSILASNLQSSSYIVSTKEFMNLFSEVEIGVVRMNPEKKEALFVLFHLLKGRGYIRVKNTSGHFKPLCINAVDHQGEKVFKRAPNKEHDLLKRYKAKYALLLQKAANMLEGAV